MTLSVKHPVPGDGIVNAVDYHAEHLLTGTPGTVLGFDGSGNGTELAVPSVGVTGLATIVGRTNLAALTAVNGDTRYLQEGGRSGLFEFSSADHSADVTADTAQGIYVAPASATSGASGAWVRHNPQGSLVFDWFGAVPGDYATGISADCLPAWSALQNYIIVKGRNVSVPFGRGGPEILFPGPQYYFNGEMPIYVTARLRGFSPGGGGEPTWLRFPADSAGVHIYYTQPSGVVTGSGTSLDGFLFQGGGGTAASTLAPNLLKSAVRVHARASITNCVARNWVGVGLLISASIAEVPGTDYHGNINGASAKNVRIEACKSGGVYVSGGDANVINLTDIDVALCGRFGYWLQPFLGAVVINCQVASCGLPSSSGLTEYSIVTYGGIQYYAKYDATTAALKAETPGTTGINWLYYGPGSGSSDVPTWNGLGNYVPGGAFGGTGDFTLLLAPYAEQDQAPPQLPNALSLQGFIGSGFGTTPQMNMGSQGFTLNKAMVQANSYVDSSTASSGIGGEFTTTKVPVLFWQSSAATGGFDPQRRSALVQDKASGDLYWDYTGNTPLLRLTGPSTARNYGRTDETVPKAVEIETLAIGSGNGARTITIASAIPTTGYHALGEMVINDGTVTSLATADHWRCSVAGTPGTWIAK